jgi:hypothetical protein
MRSYEMAEAVAVIAVISRTVQLTDFTSKAVAPLTAYNQE